MASAGTRPESISSLRERLLERGLLIATGVPGLFGRGAQFEETVDRVDRFVMAMGLGDEPEVMRFPPMLPRASLARSGYLASFPHLAGCIHSFDGRPENHDAMLRQLDAGEDWASALSPTDVALTPAACYPVYPAASGTLPAGGRLVDVMSYCFRREPSDDPARMQAFRMHEHVRLGEPDTVRAFRDLWLERGQAMLATLGLNAAVAPANDPFFGRRGRMLAATQREQSLKFELVYQLTDGASPTALASCNYHGDHLARAFGVHTHTGDIAHTACVGFGLERIALALFGTHGLDAASWPCAVQSALDASPT